MDRVLAVARSDDDHSLIREAAMLSEGVDAELVVLYLLSRSEFDEHIDVRDEIGSYEAMSGGDPTAGEFATDRAEEVTNTALNDTDVDGDPRIIGALSTDDPADTVLETARDAECDYIFLAGRKRSPTGKALFGDVTQSVLMGFDGYVTVEMRE